VVFFIDDAKFSEYNQKATDKQCITVFN